MSPEFSRRNVLRTLLTTVGAAAVACDSQPQSQPSSTSSSDEILVRMQGMLGYVFSRSASSKRYAGLDVAAIRVDEPVAISHWAVMSIPRVLIEQPSNVRPDSVDATAAHWLLDDRVVEFTSQSENSIVVRDAVPSDVIKHQSNDDWASIFWITPSERLYQQSLVREWRQLPVVGAIVRLSMGATIEPPFPTGVLSADDAPQGTYYYQKADGAREQNPAPREIKHVVRAKLSRNDRIVISIRNRSSKDVQEVHLRSGSVEDQHHGVISITNYPLEWTPLQVGRIQQDTFSYGKLCGVPIEQSFAATLAAVPSYTNGCDCCSEFRYDELLEADSLRPLL